MRLNQNVNTVINEIMLNDNACIFLFADKSANKEDFISEITSRYFKHFWISPKIDDLYELCMTLAERIMYDDPKTVQHLRQLLFCQSLYNGPKAVVRTVLDYVRDINREVLVVFENMDLLPESYDYTLLRYFINNAPRNLKILIVSDDFLPIGLYGFEPKYPMLIDSKILPYKNDEFTIEEYISELDESQIAFLTYIAKGGVVSQSIFEDKYPELVQVLKYLSRKGAYVSARERNDFDDVIYIFDDELKAYLLEIAPKYASYLGDYADVDIHERIVDGFFNLDRDYFEYLSYAIKIRSYDHADRAVKAILSSTKHIYKITNYLRAHKELLSFMPNKEYPHVTVFKICLDVAQKVASEETLQDIERLKEYFKEQGDWNAYGVLATAECTIYDERGDAEKVLSIIEEVKDVVKDIESVRLLYVGVLLMLPNFPRYSSFKASELDKLILSPGASEQYWYFKAIEDLAFYYYALGNYRKSLEITNYIHRLLHTYVVPPRLVAMCYYDVEDPIVMERRVDDALKFSLENGLDDEIHMLYTAKSLIYAYRGEKSKSREYGDLSLQHLKAKNSYEKFFTIMIRVWQHARAGEHAYAHDLGAVYLAYCRAKAPEYVPFMLSALGYALFKMGKTEEAYLLAKEAIKTGENRSVAWLMCMGIATNYLFYKEDIKQVDSLLGNIIKTANTHGMLKLIVDFAIDVFAPILDYAERNDVESKTIMEILSLVRLKEGKEEVSANVKINMFGDVYITVDGKELQWKTRKSKDLFLHYVLAGDVGIDRNVILDFLWKDYLYESAINNLKTTNNIIRKTLDAAGVKYKINYLNSRYSIKVENLDNDYTRYKMLVENYSKEPELSRKTQIMDDILKIYKADFALDIAYSDFEHERVSIKQELVINMIKLVRALAKAGEYVESKRFLNSLMLIDSNNDYTHMVYELDKFINLTK